MLNSTWSTIYTFVKYLTYKFTNIYWITQYGVFTANDHFITFSISLPRQSRLLATIYIKATCHNTCWWTFLLPIETVVIEVWLCPQMVRIISVSMKQLITHMRAAHRGHVSLCSSNVIRSWLHHSHYRLSCFCAITESLLYMSWAGHIPQEPCPKMWVEQILKCW